MWHFSATHSGALQRWPGPGRQGRLCRPWRRLWQPAANNVGGYAIVERVFTMPHILGFSLWRGSCRTGAAEALGRATAGVSAQRLTGASASLVAVCAQELLQATRRELTRWRKLRGSAFKIKAHKRLTSHWFKTRQ